MSAKILGKVWDLDLPHNKLLILLALADHADHEGNNVFPSLGLVAWKTGYSQQQCRRVMADLEKDGILIAVQRKPGVKTIYRIDVGKGILKEPYNSTPSKMSGVSKSNPFHPDRGNPLHFVTPTPYIVTAKPSLEPSVLEPSVVTKRESEQSSSSVRAPAPPIHSYIQAWADVRGIDAVNIGAPIYSERDLKQAKRMAKWAIPPTVEEIKAAIAASKSKDYLFAWLEADIPKARLAKLPPKNGAAKVEEYDGEPRLVDLNETLFKKYQKGTS